MDPGLESKVRLVSAITTLLQNAPDLGNSQLKVVSVLKWLNFFEKKDELNFLIIPNLVINDKGQTWQKVKIWV